MSQRNGQFLVMSDLYLAYRKAKAEAFYENTHFHALAFSDYEIQLEENLRELHRRLSDPSEAWLSDTAWLGGYAYAPKSVDSAKAEEANQVFYRFLDPLEDWERQWEGAGKTRLKSNFRLVITPSVNFQIVSALWILNVGHKYDSALDSNLSFGNRLRRGRDFDWTESGIHRSVNLDCIGLFTPYFSAYTNWRKNGLDAMRNALEENERIVAVTMDLQRFYHRVSPKFLVRKKFLEMLGIQLTKQERKFTDQLIKAMQCWYESTPDASDRPQGAIPVGLSASKIIANVLLTEFDRGIRDTVDPAYYGRYVDDVFMVVRLHDSPMSGDDVMKRLVDQLPNILKYKSRVPGEDGAGLRIDLDYARDSELLFTGSKQKVFNLSGHYGLDLVRQASEQIRKHSSEHRLLPFLPDSAEGMASRALLAQPSASLEADALRKADAISVRRLGLSLLLRDVEAYARDLRPNAWKARRTQFYDLVQRHVVTPVGFFDFFSYIHRVFGLMISCGDFLEAMDLVKRLIDVVTLLERTTTAGTMDRDRFDACRRFYAHALMQVAMQSSTVTNFPWKRARAFASILRKLKAVHTSLTVPSGSRLLKTISVQLLHTDWGRRPYRDYWIHRGQRSLSNPRVPTSRLVRGVLAGVRAFRQAAEIPIPYWPGVVFPTRPLSLGEITLAAPSLLKKPAKLRSTLFAFRGARMRHWDGVAEHSDNMPESPTELIVRTKMDSEVRIAVPSFLTTDDQWRSALVGRPMLDIDRYERTMKIANEMMREIPQPHYIIFPECSIPEQWAQTIAHKLAGRGISMMAGLEYRTTRLGIRNDAHISLCTHWPWYASALNFRQPKIAPSHDERSLLWKAGRKQLYKPRGGEVTLPVYVHGKFCFGVIICSDLTNIAHRAMFNGAVDAIFVLEWNKDVESFSSLVEATAQDLHGYVIQVNNRQYGDSRVRAPKTLAYERDVVRVKGGLGDYYVTCTLNIDALRNSQLRHQGRPKNEFKKSTEDFKPTPIGYRMSARRKDSI